MVEDDRAILRADVGALAVQRRWIVNGEEDLEDLSIGDELRVKRNLHYFSMPGIAGADLMIRRPIDAAAGIAGCDFIHAAQLFESRLEAPETAAAQRGNLAAARLYGLDHLFSSWVAFPVTAGFSLRLPCAESYSSV